MYSLIVQVVGWDWGVCPRCLFLAGLVTNYTLMFLIREWHCLYICLELERLLSRCKMSTMCLNPCSGGWVGATKKQCDELLEFIRHLAEDDKEGVMATKVSMYTVQCSRLDHCGQTPDWQAYIFFTKIYGIGMGLLCYWFLYCRCWTCCGTLHGERTAPRTLMDHALNAHIKILDYSCSQVCSFIGYRWALLG